MNDHCNAPDSEGLAIAREIQKKVHPSEIILGGSRAVGDHRATGPALRIKSSQRLRLRRRASARWK